MSIPSQTFESTPINISSLCSQGPTLLIERDVLLFESGHLKLEVEALQEQISQLVSATASSPL